MYVFKLVNCHNFKYFRNSLQANLSYVLVGQFDSCKRSFNHGFRHDLALLVQLDALQRGRQSVHEQGICLDIFLYSESQCLSALVRSRQVVVESIDGLVQTCLLYTSPSPRDRG